MLNREEKPEYGKDNPLNILDKNYVIIEAKWMLMQLIR